MKNAINNGLIMDFAYILPAMMIYDVFRDYEYIRKLEILIALHSLVAEIMSPIITSDFFELIPLYNPINKCTAIRSG